MSARNNATRDGVTLVVNGTRYNAWKSLRVTRSIESLAGSFALEVSDRLGDEEPWPIGEGDACRVELDGEVVIDGYINDDDASGSATSTSLSYSGRDRAAELVDCSAVLEHWTYRNVNVLEFAKKLAAPFGISVSQQPGLVLPQVPKLVVSPGDTAYEAIRKAAGDDGVLIVSDGAGGIRITRAAAARAAALIEGVNINSYALRTSGGERFYRYIVSTQAAATDEASGDLTRIRAEAIDQGVKRKNRVLLIRPEKGYTLAAARARADWEARIRAARAQSPSITVVGWRQPNNGLLWAPNALTYVKSPSMKIDGDLLITQVDYGIDEQGGTITQLKLVRPDAFTPEPKKATVKGSGARGGYPELKNGAL